MCSAVAQVRRASAATRIPDGRIHRLDCSSTVVYTLFRTGACGKKTPGCGATGEARTRSIRKRTPSGARARSQWGRFWSNGVAAIQSPSPQEGSELWHNKKYGSMSFKRAPRRPSDECSVVRAVLATYDIRREIDSLPHQLIDLLTTDKLIE